jgi:hypothetical protein
LAYSLGRFTVPALPLRDGAFETLSNFYHETFHAFQKAHFARGHDVREVVSPATIAAPEFAARAETERRLLRAALDARDVRSVRERLRVYLAVRWVRLHAVPDSVGAVERQIERYEGSAHLIGYEAALIATRGDTAGLADTLRHSLTVSLTAFPAGPGPEWRLIRWRVYGTGAAIGHLLGRLGQDWRPALQGGAFFDDLAARSVGFDSTQACPLALTAAVACNPEPGGKP